MTKIAFVSSTVRAGFPSPAEDHIEKKLDLNELLIPRPASTFLVRVEGDSMIDANIQPGDVLIVDRSQKAGDGSIVIAVLNGEFTVKRIVRKEDGLFLLPENGAYSPIPIDPDADFQIWGVVTYIIHKTHVRSR
jgi:DNA polymerase V